jgi:ribosomal protein L32
MKKTTMINDVRKCLKCGTYHSMNKNNCSDCGSFLYPVGTIYQPKVEKQDIAPVFKQLLSKLPVTILDDMQNSFSIGLNNKAHITDADKAILQSFNDERARRCV